MLCGKGYLARLRRGLGCGHMSTTPEKIHVPVCNQNARLFHLSRWGPLALDSRLAGSVRPSRRLSRGYARPAAATPKGRFDDLRPLGKRPLCGYVIRKAADGL